MDGGIEVMDLWNSGMNGRRSSVVKAIITPVSSDYPPAGQPLPAIRDYWLYRKMLAGQHLHQAG